MKIIGGLIKLLFLMINFIFQALPLPVFVGLLIILLIALILRTRS